MPEESLQGISYANGALELETPDDGTTIGNPLNGGLRAWLIVLSCFGINILQGVILLLINAALFTDDQYHSMTSDTGIDIQTLQHISAQFLNMSDIYAALAAFVMIFLGNAPTVIIGAGVVMATLFFLSYLGDDDTEDFIKFLIYGPTGQKMNDSEIIDESIVPEESLQELGYANHANGALKLETPKDGATTEEPPDGGLRAWLIVLSCVGINIFLSMILALISAVLTDNGFSHDTNITSVTSFEMSTKFLSTSNIYGALAALVMILYGYTPTVIIGAGVVMSTLFFVSYLGDDDTEGLIKFLLYGPAAVGVSFIQLGALIPLLEYFTTKRFKALLLSRLGFFFGGIIIIPFRFVPSITFKWRVGLRASSALCIGIGLIGLTLKDLGLKMKNDQSVTFVQKTLGLAKTDIMRNVLLWATFVVFFVYQWGIETAKTLFTNIDVSKELELNTDMAKSLVYAFSQPIGMGIGVFSGWMFKKTAMEKKDSWFTRIKLMNSLWNFVFVILMINAFTIGIACFIAPYAADFFYFLPFSLGYAASTEFCGRMRDDIIPKEFGIDNIKFVEGLIIMATGLGGIITTEITAKISDKSQWEHGSNYGGGMLMFTTAVIAFVLFLKEKKYLDKITICGAQSEAQTNTNMESSSVPWVGNADVTQEQKSPWSLGSNAKRQSNSPNQTSIPWVGNADVTQEQKSPWRFGSGDKRQSNAPYQTNSSAQQNPIYDPEVLY